MFRCERCESQYSALHAAALENCPRCQIRDRVSAPLTLKVFELPFAWATDAGLKELAAFKQLTAVLIPSPTVTPDGLREFRRALPNCKINW